MDTNLHDIDTYWNSNTILDEGIIDDEPALIRLKMHRSEECYYHKKELFPLSTPTGERIYFHARPYILIPDMTMTFAPYRKPAPDGSIGHVIGTDVTKLKQREIGNAQAWYYPAEKALVLWECFLEAPYRQPDPQQDSLHTVVWQGFERLLQEQVPEITRIYTTFEPIYDRPIFSEFLTAHGYRHCDTVAFVKDIVRTHGGREEMSRTKQ